MREFELIESIRQANVSLGTSVVVPPGDDLGMIELPGGGTLLAGVDQVVAGVHLLPDAPPEAYGRKLVHRSLSDVAAMAAVPVGMIVAASLPPELVGEGGSSLDGANGPDSEARTWAERFADAARGAGAALGCPLFGGDVACLPPGTGAFTASATVLAVADEQADGRVVLRNGAVAGQRMYVTGRFGRSFAADGGGHHLDFEPRIAVACALNRMLGERIGAMIDVSDGLAADAAHIARESGVLVELDAERVPRRDGAGAVEALTDGEDYELCFSVTEGEELPSAIEGVELTHVGRVLAGTGLRVLENGDELGLERRGWEHAG